MRQRLSSLLVLLLAWASVAWGVDLPKFPLRTTDLACADTAGHPDGLVWYNLTDHTYRGCAAGFAAALTSPLPATPTAHVGLTVVPGVLATYMRSDAAPPLDQAIAPTWTGVHTFASSKLLIAGATSGALTLAVPAVAGTHTLTWPAGTTDFSATGGTGQYLKQASVGAALTVGTIPPSDIVGTALTRTDDTNVTLTLGGTPTTALLAATSLTLGWSGQLGLARGGNNADLSLTGGASQVLRQSSAGAAVTVSQLACSDLSTASGGCSMSTTAGGDLSGTLPSPTVAKVGGVAYPSGPATNTVPVVTGASTITYEAVPNAALANSSITVNGSSISLGGSKTLTLASSDFANQGTTTTLLHGNAAGNPAFSAVVSADLNLTTTMCTNQALTALSSAAAGTCTTLTSAYVDSSIATIAAANTFTSATGQSMKKVLLPGSTSGTLTVLAAATAGTSTLTLPGGTTDFSATGGTGQYLKQTSTGAALTVGTIPASDIASGAALTKSDDTNVTLSLSGTPTTALLAATSLTLGWSGQLGLTRGGTAASLTASNGGIVYSTASALAILGGTATAGHVLLSGANTLPSWSTPTYPSASGTSGKVLISDGTNNVYSTSTLPTSAGATSGKVLLSDGTNYVLSTPTFPNASAPALKSIRSDGTNWIESTATVSDTPSTALKWLRSDGTNWITSTATLSDSPSTAGKVLVSDGTNWITSTPTFPNASATSGKWIRSDGTNWLATTTTIPDTFAISTIPYASAANVLSALATANNGVLITSGTGVPSISSTIPSATQDNITRLGTVTTGAWNATALAALYGGTGLSAYAVGDLLYASATTPTLSRLAAVASGSVLASAGVSTAPAWSAAPTLTTSLTTPTIYGGTAASSTLALRGTSNGSPSNAFILLNPSNEGNVGINVATADYKLHLAASSTTEALLLKLENTGTQTVGQLASILFRGSNATVGAGGGAQLSAIAESATGGNRQTGLAFYTDQQSGAVGLREIVRVSALGAVGIQTTTPTNIISLSGQAARTIWMERNTTANTSGLALTVQAGGATSGAQDKDGGQAILAPGANTGLGRSTVTLKGYTVAVATGTGDGTQLDRQVVGAFKALTNNSAITIVNATNAASGMIGGRIDYIIEVTDGTNYQVESGSAYYSGYNKAGTIATTITEVSSQQNLSSGTLATTWAISAAQPAAISINANSSLTPSTGYPRITYTLHNGAQQAIAMQ